MICPLSVIMTALVRRPLVMSIRAPLLRPSWIVRLVGAEVGDTIPGDLFGAVAEVLAYLIRLKQIAI